MAYTYAGQYGPEDIASKFGVPQPNDTISVFLTGTNVLATLYTNSAKGGTASNPTLTDSLGNLTFFADPGVYDVLANNTTFTVIVPVHPNEWKTGTPQAPTQAGGDNSTNIATTAWVKANGGGGGNVSSVFTRTGAITAQSGDYTAAQVGALPTTGGTMSGAIAMGSNKVTGLANGTAASDAAAFGQIPTTLPPNGTAGGDLTGTYPNPSVNTIGSATSMAVVKLNPNSGHDNAADINNAFIAGATSVMLVGATGSYTIDQPIIIPPQSTLWSMNPVFHQANNNLSVAPLGGLALIAGASWSPVMNATQVAAYSLPAAVDTMIYGAGNTSQAGSSRISGITVDAGTTVSMAYTGIASDQIHECLYRRGTFCTFFDYDFQALQNSVTVSSAALTVSRSDTATCAGATATIADTTIVSTDYGRAVSGTGIPSGAFVGTVVASTSFTLVDSSGTSLPAAYNVGSITLGPYITVTTSAAHGLAGQNPASSTVWTDPSQNWVLPQAFNSHLTGATIDGIPQRITSIPSTTTFTFNVAGASALSAAGTITALGTLGNNTGESIRQNIEACQIEAGGAWCLWCNSVDWKMDGGRLDQGVKYLASQGNLIGNVHMTGGQQIPPANSNTIIASRHNQVGTQYDTVPTGNTGPLGSTGAISGTPTASGGQVTVVVPQATGVSISNFVSIGQKVIIPKKDASGNTVTFTVNGVDCTGQQTVTSISNTGTTAQFTFAATTGAVVLSGGTPIVVAMATPALSNVMIDRNTDSNNTPATIAAGRWHENNQGYYGKPAIHRMAANNNSPSTSRNAPMNIVGAQMGAVPGSSFSALCDWTQAGDVFEATVIDTALQYPDTWNGGNNTALHGPPSSVTVSATIRSDVNTNADGSGNRVGFLYSDQGNWYTFKATGISGAAFNAGVTIYPVGKTTAYTGTDTISNGNPVTYCCASPAFFFNTDQHVTNGPSGSALPVTYRISLTNSGGFYSAQDNVNIVSSSSPLTLVPYSTNLYLGSTTATWTLPSNPWVGCEVTIGCLGTGSITVAGGSMQIPGGLSRTSVAQGETVTIAYGLTALGVNIWYAVQDVFNAEPVFNVLSYGADPSGSSDSTSAIAAAISAAATSSSTGGAIVYFPAGTYLIGNGAGVGITVGDAAVHETTTTSGTPISAGTLTGTNFTTAGGGPGGSSGSFAAATSTLAVYTGGSTATKVTYTGSVGATTIGGCTPSSLTAPSGAAIVQGTQSTQNNITLRGAGMPITSLAGSTFSPAVKLQWNGSAGGTMLKLMGPINGIRVENLYLDANAGATAAYGVWARAAQECKFSNLWVNKATSANYYLTGVNGFYVGSSLLVGACINNDFDFCGGTVATGQTLASHFQFTGDTAGGALGSANATYTHIHNTYAVATDPGSGKASAIFNFGFADDIMCRDTTVVATGPIQLAYSSGGAQNSTSFVTSNTTSPIANSKIADLNGYIPAGTTITSVSGSSGAYTVNLSNAIVGGALSAADEIVQSTIGTIYLGYYNFTEVTDVSGNVNGNCPMACDIDGLQSWGVGQFSTKVTSPLYVGVPGAPNHVSNINTGWPQSALLGGGNGIIPTQSLGLTPVADPGQYNLAWNVRGGSAIVAPGPNPNNITAMSGGAANVTITTQTAHGYAVGQSVTLTNLTTGAFSSLNNTTVTTIAGTTGSTVVFANAGFNGSSATNIGSTSVTGSWNFFASGTPKQVNSYQPCTLIVREISAGANWSATMAPFASGSTLLGTQIPLKHSDSGVALAEYTYDIPAGWFVAVTYTSGDVEFVAYTRNG